MSSQTKNYLSWIEIDQSAIRHNYGAIRKLAQRHYREAQLIPSARKAARYTPMVLAVIKADAYGHGMREAARVLCREGIGFLGVSDVREGIVLREAGIKKPILLLESPLPACAEQIVNYDLTPTVATFQLASALNAYAKNRRRKVNVHVEVDTGMGRLGIWHGDAQNFIRVLMQFPFLNVQGIYTHFPLADTNARFTRYQIKDIHTLVRGLDRSGRVVPFVHAANSMGLAGYKTRLFNIVRPGLMIYGLYPSPKLRNKISLKPVMSVKSRVIFFKRIRRGQGISYGHTFIAPRDMTVATLSIGYSDGYLRCLSNKARVIINGRACPLIGNVTMDQIMVDATSVKNLTLGMEVTALGKEGKAEVSADDLARHAGTINYEIVCNLGNRLPRVFV